MSDEKKVPAVKKPPKLETMDDVRDFMREKIIKRYGSLAAYAREEGWGTQYVSNVLTHTESCQRPIPEQMWKRFRVTHHQEIIDTFTVRA
jgi:hypothetical protein